MRLYGLTVSDLAVAAAPTHSAPRAWLVPRWLMFSRSSVVPTQDQDPSPPVWAATMPVPSLSSHDMGSSPQSSHFPRLHPRCRLGGSSTHCSDLDTLAASEDECVSHAGSGRLSAAQGASNSKLQPVSDDRPPPVWAPSHVPDMDDNPRNSPIAAAEAPPTGNNAVVSGGEAGPSLPQSCVRLLCEVYSERLALPGNVLSRRLDHGATAYHRSATGSLLFTRSSLPACNFPK